MRRWLFNLATAVSLALCVAVGVLWVRSYRIGTLVGYLAQRGTDGMYHDRYLAQAEGGIHIVVFRQDVPTAPVYGAGLQIVHFAVGPSSPRSSQSSSPTRAQWSFAGFSYDQRRNLPAREWSDWTIPHWFLVILTTAIPGVWLYRFIKARRVKRLGLCPTCGYDLRATPQRCPECGAVPGGGDRRSGLSDQKSETVPPSV